MASVYPGAQDNFATNHADNVGEVIEAADVNDLADATNKIEIELDLTKLQVEDMTSGLMTGNPTTWSVTNETTDRVFDANSTSLDEMADALGTLIEDLKTRGILT